MSGIFGNGGSSNTKNVTSTTTPTPYAAAKPGWDQYFKDLTGAYKGGALNLSPFPGQTVAPTSPETVQAWQGTADRAMAGSDLNRGAADWVMSRLDPNFLSQTPPELQALLDDTANDVGARFSMGGRSFSGANAGALGKAMGGVRYQDLLRRSGEQQAAAQFAPTLAREDYFDLSQLGSVGSQREGKLQDLINAEIERFNALQGGKANELSLYADLLGGLGSGGSSTTSPVASNKLNPWQTALQGAGTAATIASLFA